ncbi:MAG: 6,7-dimethyl-8-ribityllumazine synthase [Armatimonadetes bacterium]|nr:6,7-dimethyl-8-ribityllumazine synthase [Armatimonadota bacterium]
MKLVGKVDASGKRFGIVVGRWNELVTKQLLEGALETLEASGAEESIVVQVPGSWEIPIACQALIERGDISGVIALGCILQGQTTHAQLLASDVSKSLMNLQTQTGIPIGYGILTPEDQDQALDRSGLKLGNKGREAAASTIEMATLLEMIRPED